MPLGHLHTTSVVFRYQHQFFFSTTDFSSLAAAAQAAQAAQHLGVSVSLPSAATAAIAAQAAASSPVTAAALQAAAAAAASVNHNSVTAGPGANAVGAGSSLAGGGPAGGGKARSSMSLQLISGRYVHEQNCSKQTKMQAASQPFCSLLVDKFEAKYNLSTLVVISALT